MNFQLKKDSGVRKTTITANLASELVCRGKKVLAIDLDPQTNFTFSYMNKYINSLSLLKVDLKENAKKYNIPLGSKETNSQIIKKIVENVIGSKLRFNALLSTDLKS